MTPGTRDDVARRLSAVVVRVTRSIRPMHGELSGGHYATLATVQRFGPQRPSDLARSERVSAPTMTRIVAVLEERGLVTRRQSAQDLRSVTVDITPEGDRLVARVRAEQAEALAGLLSALDDEQVGAIAGALDALDALAREAVGAPASARR